MKPKPDLEREIQEIVDRETRAWNTKDADLLLTIFHPDMVWTWPPHNQAHDPIHWVFGMGRFDAVRWKKVWQDLFETHELIHNRRQTRRIEISDQGDGAFAIVDVDTLWRDRHGGDFHWKGRACKVYSQVGDQWKMTMHTGLLEY